MSYPLLVLEDKNTKCASLMATIELGDYLTLVEKAYDDQGGLTGQRAPIRTKTALKIRNRLVQDLKQGAVIPPVVIGLVCSNRLKSKLRVLETSDELVGMLKANGSDLSIIDGMQRTTALKEAFGTKTKNHYIRVEIWVAEKVSSLIYRMLVLNTGQVPWDLKRQLDTLYRPIIAEVKHQLPKVKIIGLDETNRRSQAGEYRSSRIIELFLAFTSRSIEIDIKEKVAEEFIKIDLTEATSSDEFLPLFIKSLELMAKLDAEFDRVKQAADGGARVKNGKDIFTSSPAAIGFVVAISEMIFGEPGFDYDLANAKKDLEKISRTMNSLVSALKAFDVDELETFMDFDTLNQMLSVKSGRVGDHDRNLYRKAFLTLIKRSKEVIRQGAMTPCWMAR